MESCCACYTTASDKWNYLGIGTICETCDNVFQKIGLCSHCFKPCISSMSSLTTSGYICLVCKDNSNKYPYKCLDCDKLFTKKAYKKDNGVICSGCYDRKGKNYICCKCLTTKTTKWYNYNSEKIKKMCRRCYTRRNNEKKKNK